MLDIVSGKDIGKGAYAIRVKSNPNTNPDNIEDFLINCYGNNVSKTNSVNGGEGPVKTSYI